MPKDEASTPRAELVHTTRQGRAVHGGVRGVRGVPTTATRATYSVLVAPVHRIF